MVLNTFKYDVMHYICIKSVGYSFYSSGVVFFFLYQFNLLPYP